MTKILKLIENIEAINDLLLFIEFFNRLNVIKIQNQNSIEKKEEYMIFLNFLLIF